MRLKLLHTQEYWSKGGTLRVGKKSEPEKARKNMYSNLLGYSFILTLHLDSISETSYLMALQIAKRAYENLHCMRENRLQDTSWWLTTGAEFISSEESKIIVGNQIQHDSEVSFLHRQSRP